MSQVLVIGSEGGLGKEIVSLWKSKDFKVWGADLHKDSQSGCDEYRPLDLSRDSFDPLLKWLGDNHLDHVIIVSAVGYYGEFTEQRNITETIRVNFLSQILLAKSLEKKLNHKAKIVFIGSVASHMPTADYEVYSATKLGIESFVRSWRWEVKDRFDVRVFLPGAMQTAFHEKVGFKVSSQQRKQFAEASSVALDLWKSLQKSQWRSGVKGSKALVLSHRFLSPLVDKAFEIKRGLS